MVYEIVLGRMQRDNTRLINKRQYGFDVCVFMKHMRYYYEVKVLFWNVVKQYNGSLAWIANSYTIN